MINYVKSVDQDPKEAADWKNNCRGVQGGKHQLYDWRLHRRGTCLGEGKTYAWYIAHGLRSKSPADVDPCSRGDGPKEGWGGCEL